MRKTLAAAVVAMIVATACTSDLTINEAAPESAAALPSTEAPAAESTTTTIPPPPPVRGPVRVVRASWDSGLVLSSIVMEVLALLGFEPTEVVIDDHDKGLAPDLAYAVLARAQGDLFTNGWFPFHLDWLDGSYDDEGGTVGDNVTLLQPIVPSGGLQGWLISKAWADAEGITSLDQIAETRSLALQLDRDGDGQGEIYGCPEDWTCDDIINSYLRWNRWMDLEQVQELPGTETQRGQPGYDAMFEEFLTHVARGEAAVAYAWSPTWQHARAQVGSDTMWLSISNEAIDIGARDPYEQSPYPEIVREDGSIGFTDLSPDVCTQGPDGCQTGWNGNDITIVGNRSWLDAHPDVVAVLNAIEFQRHEASELVADLGSLDLTEWDDKVAASHTIARAWMDANPDRVAAWLDAAS
jgi:ABC-type proline/glycine betaine transport system substrate-binding protein